MTTTPITSPTRHDGQYWTPQEARSLVQWWNRQRTGQAAVWTEEHAAYVATANLVDHDGDQPRPFITVGTTSMYVGTFLYVAEMLRDSLTGALPRDAIFKGPRDQRWSECLVPHALKALDLDLHFEVKELVDGRLLSLCKHPLDADWATLSILDDGADAP